MESNEHPSVPVTSEVVSNNYAQQKIEALCKEVKVLNKNYCAGSGTTNSSGKSEKHQ